MIGCARRHEERRCHRRDRRPGQKGHRWDETARVANATRFLGERVRARERVVAGAARRAKAPRQRFVPWRAPWDPPREPCCERRLHRPPGGVLFGLEELLARVTSRAGHDARAECWPPDQHRGPGRQMSKRPREGARDACRDVGRARHWTPHTRNAVATILASSIGRGGPPPPWRRSEQATRGRAVATRSRRLRRPEVTYRSRCRRHRDAPSDTRSGRTPVWRRGRRDCSGFPYRVVRSGIRSALAGRVRPRHERAARLPRPKGR